jgi:hypothetical protein
MTGLRPGARYKYRYKYRVGDTGKSSGLRGLARASHMWILMPTLSM